MKSIAFNKKLSVKLGVAVLFFSMFISYVVRQIPMLVQTLAPEHYEACSAFFESTTGTWLIEFMEALFITFVMCLCFHFLILRKIDSLVSLIKQQTENPSSLRCCLPKSDEIGHLSNQINQLLDIRDSSKAKLESFTLLLENKNYEVETMNKVFLEEQESAREYYDKIVHFGCLAEMGIHYRANPLGVFSGDVILSAQEANRPIFHLALADMTGHGLGAAIGLIPMVNAFYTKLEKQATKEHMVSILNHTIRRYAPTGKYCAMLYVVIDYENNQYHYWNAGLPAGFHVQTQSSSYNELNSRHLYLGALSEGDFDSEFTTLPFTPGDKLYLYTDGILELKNSHGEMFGKERLYKVLRETASENEAEALDDLFKSLTEYSGEYYQEDDITFLAIPLGKQI